MGEIFKRQSEYDQYLIVTDCRGRVVDHKRFASRDDAKAFKAHMDKRDGIRSRIVERRRKR